MNFNNILFIFFLNPIIHFKGKLITIHGQKLPPPPRKVVIERLAPLPNKPQSVLIERWLPYTQTKRKVIFQGNKFVKITNLYNFC